MGVVDELRAQCDYDPEQDGSVDDLIAYKDALEDALAVDAEALDALAEILRQPTWPSGADFLDVAAFVVRGTGRKL